MNNWQTISLAINKWASKKQTATHDDLQARITALVDKRASVDKIEADLASESLTTIVDWGHIPQQKASLLIEELGIRNDILTYLATDRVEQSQYRSQCAVGFEKAKEKVLGDLLGIGYDLDSLTGCDILLRHPSVKAMRLECDGSGVDNGVSEEHREAIGRLTGELQALRNRKVI
jgi:hypothetical protein